MGIDFLMDMRWIYCLHEGLPLDIDVYDSATWSCLAGLTQRSVDNRGDGLKSYLGTAARSVAIDRLRKSIRPLDALLRAGARPAFDHSFGWWYLPGPYGKRRENEAAMLATLGRSVIGREGGIHLQLNHVSRETLIDAQKHSSGP